MACPIGMCQTKVVNLCPLFHIVVQRQAVKRMDPSIIVYIIIGFLAQIVDGTLGMAYGVISSTVLVSIGLPPTVSTASAHTAEIFTSGVSGLSHLRLGNVDSKMFRQLLVPGVIGGVLGAYIFTAVPGEKLRPLVALYLLIVGLVIVGRALRKAPAAEVRTKLFPLGIIGGFFDAIGGGGWGPIVTSTLVARGHHPRFTIGSVNLAEFFVTFCEAAIFLATIRLIHWKIIFGLVIGGILAAPLAAYACKRLPRRTLAILVGILAIALSVNSIYQALS